MEAQSRGRRGTGETVTALDEVSADQAIAIDELSGGRLILGIGPNNQEMIEAIGYAWKDTRVALRETTQMLRCVFTGDASSDFPIAFRPTKHGVPTHLAAMALETVELAGKIADGVMLYVATRERFQQCVSRAERGARQAGRNPHHVL
jgi:5,10-methylenetetrahydromethanopterin reductase